MKYGNLNLLEPSWFFYLIRKTALEETTILETTAHNI
jgi:hypothetical protein